MNNSKDKESLFDYNLLQNREIYIWGLGVFGLCILQELLNKKISIKGIIDQRSEIWGEYYKGVPVLNNDEIFNLESKNAIFIITATKPQSINQIINKIHSYNENYSYIISNNSWTVQIDISGVCNLRCKSCQVENHGKDTFSYSNRGFMNPDKYDKILNKLNNDIPDNKCINFYLYGDPFLSPYLPELINITHEHGLFSILSTNLSMETNIKDILITNPSCIKVSLSGFTQSVYETTHNKGDIRLVKSNLYYIKYLIHKHKLSTNIIVGYHLYNNNLGDEYKKMQLLCEELGFLFQPTEALYANNFKRMGLEHYNEDDIAFIKSYYNNWEEVLKPLEINEEPNYECGLLDKGIFIDYDGKIVLCCTTLHNEAILPINYLDTSLDEINNIRKKHWICNECKKHGLSWM